MKREKLNHKMLVETTEGRKGMGDKNRAQKVMKRK